MTYETPTGVNYDEIGNLQKWISPKFSFFDQGDDAKYADDRSMNRWHDSEMKKTVKCLAVLEMKKQTYPYF